MGHVFTTLIASSLAATSAVARPACEGEPTMCRTVTTAEMAFAGMLATGDPAPFVTHVDDRAIYVTADGQPRGKADMIALVRSGPRHASARLDSLTVRQFGDTAIAIWTESWADPGRTGTTSGVDTWLRRNGRWRVIASREAKNAS